MSNSGAIEANLVIKNFQFRFKICSYFLHNGLLFKMLIKKLFSQKSSNGIEGSDFWSGRSAPDYRG